MDNYSVTLVSHTSLSSKVSPLSTDRVSPPPSTGILSSFKLASQKIANLTNKSSPCKLACNYHSQLASTKTWVNLYQTDSPTKVPRNQRVTLPPLSPMQDHQVIPTPVLATFQQSHKQESTDLPQSHEDHPHSPEDHLYTPEDHPLTPRIINTPSRSRSSSKTSISISNCIPLLCTKRLTFLSDEKSSHVSKSRHSEQAFISSKWKATFQKAEIHQPKKKVKPVKITTQVCSWEHHISPQKVSVNMKPKTPWGSPTLWQPFSEDIVGNPHQSSTQSMCSQFYNSMTSVRGSCRDPDGIQERTRNNHSLLEDEDGGDIFRQDIQDNQRGIAAASSHVHSVRNSLCPPQLTPSTNPACDKSKNTSQMAQLHDNTKRKLGSIYKHLPLKKRFSPNFCESSAPVSKPQSPPKKKPTTPHKRHRESGKKTFRGSVIVNEETTRTSRARKPMESMSTIEETVLQLEELLTIFMASKKTLTTLILHSSKHKMLLEYAHLCYITAVRISGGIRLRKTSASRAPIPMDKEWMLP